MGIKLRLLALVLVAALPVLVLEVLTELGVREQRMSELRQDALRAARLIAAEQDQYFESARNVLATYLQSPTVRELDEAECSAYLRRLLDEFPAYTGFGVATPDGTIVCSSNPGTVGFNVFGRDYFQETLSGKSFAVGQVLPQGTVTGRRIVGMSYPLLDEVGDIVLVGVLGLDLERLSTAIGASHLQPGSAVLVLDSHGTIMARAPDGPRWIAEAAPQDVEAALSAGAGDSILEVEDVDGVTRIYGFTELVEGAHVRIGAGLPMAPLLARADRQFLQRMVPLVLVFIAAASLAWIGGEIAIRRPLAAMQRSTDRIAAGDLATRSGTVSQVPEFARLGRSFDAMAESLERHERELQQALADKELLFQEMNHRIKNSLQFVSSMLTLQATRPGEPELRDRLAAAQARVMTVARIHQRLYQTDQINTIEFAQYLRELCVDIAASIQRGEDRCVIEVEASPTELPVDRAVPLALIANELITNALKHAYPEGAPGIVRVDFATVPGEGVRLQVADHGVGLPDGQGERDGNSLGLRLVRALVQQLKGTLTIERTEPGSRIVVRAPSEPAGR